MIQFALIGFGHIGRRHAEHIKNNAAAKLVAVCDSNTEVAVHLPDPKIPFFTDVAAMLETVKADVVCVCTPNYLHAQHTVAVLAQGMHALVEKPMALSTAECDEMIAATHLHNKTIFVVKQNRYNPTVAAVKELLRKDALGKVLMMQVNCFWNRGDAYYAQSDWRGDKKKDGGCLFTQFSHFTDILYYLNGPIVSAEGFVQNYLHQHNTQFEDSGSFVMNAINGAIINFNFTTCSFEKNMEGSITILAEKGTIKIGGQYLNTLEYQCLEGTALPQINISAKENDYGLYKGSMSNHDKVIQNVIDVLENDGPIMTSADEGKAVIQMIEMMYAGAATTM